ncbi:RsmB/NOP family class I SAM-dependent RNA methyltransferase [Brevibacillus fulvus]|uniref:NOL1/NOP2/sun family putative RNA methylase n=1 Tax=Brevibacillus fulvus TaxID=1125967 RepID=A0A938Y327_9BACL|nr:RsmB/NOP family class I SAM-dependent RNA methyltransferase [Brevibacillus fulvus]MBM7590727.1 NOL1/NOP2/sun family putative RNA methylase [Brevibacillus fulvus]
MNIQLPQPFINRMQALLPDTFAEFLDSYQQPAAHGLRVNPLKLEAATLQRIAPFPLEPIPWCPTGFAYPDGVRPGKHPYHAAGLYYLQEPSAMAVAETLAVQADERVLDLCAAPGGKTTQLAGAMKGQGLLIANEIHPARAKALSENIERMGITNAIVFNETPEHLASLFPQFFDKILVDAPCSGEGMFRKLPEAIADWSEGKVAECHRMQTDILAAAAMMLKPGGTLVYSTCTFAPLENEQTIADFLADHPEFELVPIEQARWFSSGRPEWATPERGELRLTARLWPHQLTGEGHFIAKLRKAEQAAAAAGRETPGRQKQKKAAKQQSGLKEAVSLWRKFAEELIPSLGAHLHDDHAFLLFGEQLYYSPAPWLDLSGMKVTRPGYHLGTWKKNRFEPAHALALAVPVQAVNRTAPFAADDPALLSYLKGETITRAGEDGWTLVTVDGYAIGWGKQAGGQLKNHYPKGLRWL